MSNESCCCGTEAPKSGSFCQRNVGSIALIVGIIALGSSLVPQIQDFCGSSENVQVTVVKEEGRPGPGGPGGGFGGGPGGPGGGFGGGPAVSEETLKLYGERIGLYDEALKSAPAERQAQLRHERCLVRLTKLRLEQGGGRRFRSSLAEAFLNRQAAKARPDATALERNQAELDYQRALDSFRGDKEAFLGTVKAFETYPGTDLSDADLLALLAAERG